MSDIHPRHAALLDLVADYIEAKPGRSARGLGLRAAGDPRMIPNLQRGGRYPAAAMLKLLGILTASLSDRARDEALLIDELGEQLGRSGGHQLRTFKMAA